MSLSFPLQSAFLALPLEGEALTRFQQIQHQLEPFSDVLNFQNPATPHLTLMYWKDLMQIEFDQVLAHATKIAEQTDPFSLSVVGYDTFGSRDEDRVIFLDVPFSEPLARLKKSCPWSDGQQFHPHITLARMPRPQAYAVNKKAIGKVLSPVSFNMNVDRLRLYGVVDGKHQTPIEDFQF